MAWPLSSNSIGPYTESNVVTVVPGLGDGDGDGDGDSVTDGVTDGTGVVVPRGTSVAPGSVPQADSSRRQATTYLTLRLWPSRADDGGPRSDEVLTKRSLGA